MATTTTRGLLWEMLAPVLRWPLYSPRRLVGTILAAVLLLAVVTRLGGGPAGDGPAAVRDSVTGSVTSPSPGAASAPSVVVAPAVVATRFVTAWAKPRLTIADWYDGILAAGVDEGLAQVLGQTDPTTIPATRIIGPATVIAEGDETAQVTIRTDGPTVLVALTRPAEGSGWVVSNILPVTSGDDGPARQAKPSQSAAAS